jgi:phospholipid transport system substrate-binding protein
MTAIPFARRTLLGGAVLTLLAASAQADPASAAGPIPPIRQLNQALLTIMQQGRATPFARRAAELTPAIEIALNLPAILRVSVGPSWAGLKPEDQNRLLDVFRQYTVATFVENFDSYEGQKITVSPQTRTLSDGAQVVRTDIIPRSGLAGHTIDYVMRRTPGGAWKATDVLADGTISRVAVMRSDFAGLLAQGGAAGLEASLQRKTAALANG